MDRQTAILRGEGNPHLREQIADLAERAAERCVREHGRNRGATVELILRWAGGQPGWAWCVAFCWAIIDLACFVLDLDPPAGMDKLSCSRLVAWAKRSGRFFIDPEQAAPGDLLVLEGGDTGYKHVAIIVGEPDSRGRFPTVEGNTNEQGSAEGDGVYSKLRDPKETPCVFVRVS